ALTMSPLTTMIMASVPLNRAGVGSAMNDTTRELGGALGVAILGSAVASVFSRDMAPMADQFTDAGFASAVSSGLPGVFKVAGSVAESGGEHPDAHLVGEAIAAGKDAFVNGMGLAATLGAAVVVLAAVLSWRLLPGRDWVDPIARPDVDEVDGAE